MPKVESETLTTTVHRRRQRDGESGAESDCIEDEDPNEKPIDMTKGSMDSQQQKEFDKISLKLTKENILRAINEIVPQIKMNDEIIEFIKQIFNFLLKNTVPRDMKELTQATNIKFNINKEDTLYILLLYEKHKKGMTFNKIFQNEYIVKDLLKVLYRSMLPNKQEKEFELFLENVISRYVLEFYMKTGIVAKKRCKKIKLAILKSAKHAAFFKLVFENQKNDDNFLNVAKTRDILNKHIQRVIIKEQKRKDKGSFTKIITDIFEERQRKKKRRESDIDESYRKRLRRIRLDLNPKKFQVLKNSFRDFVEAVEPSDLHMVKKMVIKPTHGVPKISKRAPCIVVIQGKKTLVEPSDPNYKQLCGELEVEEMHQTDGPKPFPCPPTVVTKTEYKPLINFNIDLTDEDASKELLKDAKKKDFLYPLFALNIPELDKLKGLLDPKNTKRVVNINLKPPPQPQRYRPPPDGPSPGDRPGQNTSKTHQDEKKSTPPGPENPYFDPNPQIPGKDPLIPVPPRKYPPDEKIPPPKIPPGTLVTSNPPPSTPPVKDPLYDVIS